jgi:regulator of protease activity HflC (stomatin/prohibitin superfamily)
VEWLYRLRTWIIAGVVAAGLFLLYQLWVWEVERVEVRPNTFLVKVHLWGKNLPEGEILAPDSSYKGVQRDLLSEGRHFLNPILYSFERVKMTEVPAGKCAVLTRKAGPEIPADRLARGEYLARGKFEDPAGERGIVREVLTPGKYRINPYEYEVEIIPAVEVKVHQVGVRVLKYGKDPRTLVGRTAKYVVPEGYQGVQEKPVPNGTHYINPYVQRIIPVDTRSHPVEFTDIKFPSQDGFTIQPHVLVAYKVMPEKAPELYVMLCDEGVLHQEDATPQQQQQNEILQKFVLPLIRGEMRIEGSKYAARDYISQKATADGGKGVNPRERLQQQMMKKVAPRCKMAGVEIESITVAHLEMDKERDKDLLKLAEAIAERETTRVEREKNKELVKQYTQDQEKAAKTALADQRKQTVEALKKLEVETERAKQLKEVAEAQFKQELEAAKTNLAAARDKVKAILAEGKSKAAVIDADNKAEVAGLKTAVSGFPTPENYAQYEVLRKLSPALTEIFASDKSDFAKVFSAYMSPATKKGSARAPANGNGARTANGKTDN